MSGTWISGKYVKNRDPEFPNSRRSLNADIYYHASTSCISGTQCGKTFHFSPLSYCLGPSDEKLNKNLWLSARWRVWTRADAYPTGLAILD